MTDHSGLRADAANAKVVYICQHGRLLIVTGDAHSGIPIIGIASRSGDGDFALQFLEPFGCKAIRGSSGDPRKPDKDKGGRAALRAARDYMKNNDKAVFALTPDGPKGPRGRCKPGAAVIAASSQTPVIASAFSARHTLRFKSWDHFMMPLPFSRIQVVWSAPLMPPDQSDREAIGQFNQQIEELLIETTREADRLAGRPDLFEPAEPA
ncbi:lysophospholipid acyltransferase family protein [Pontivivens insulae]|uniref:lysophospholipid acyltransferase family protein n=1 Tax=Pontivivens insulae TaxID=1639689 RepID=UPI0013C33320|nr:DUF374 domain-containing protein [Pontivivens insulae]